MLPLSPVSTISLYLENKLSMPLSPIHTNYPKTIINLLTAELIFMEKNFFLKYSL